MQGNDDEDDDEEERECSGLLAIVAEPVLWPLCWNCTGCAAGLAWFDPSSPSPVDPRLRTISHPHSLRNRRVGFVVGPFR